MATLTVGPLSFVGLMAPHMARMLGFRRALPQMVIAALLGGLLMVFADWCGRMLLFPYQIPLGYWRPLSVRRTSFICCVSRRRNRHLGRAFSALKGSASLSLFIFQGVARSCERLRKTILRAKRNTRRGGEMNILRAGALDLCLWSLRERYKEKPRVDIHQPEAYSNASQR